MDAIGIALRVLRQRRDNRRGPALFGQIAQHDRNFEGPLGTYAPKALPNTLVRVRTDWGVYKTQADSDGLYAFYDPAAGRYEFAPELPQGTTLSWFIGSDRPQLPFQLSGTGCQERNIEVFASGSIQGRILDSANKALPHAFVYIVRADEKVLPKERQLYWESQGKEGSFKFVHIPPDRYLVLVKPDDSHSLTFLTRELSIQAFTTVH
jgi:hypothetical protein